MNAYFKCLGVALNERLFQVLGRCTSHAGPYLTNDLTTCLCFFPTVRMLTNRNSPATAGLCKPNITLPNTALHPAEHAVNHVLANRAALDHQISMTLPTQGYKPTVGYPLPLNTNIDVASYEVRCCKLRGT